MVKEVSISLYRCFTLAMQLIWAASNLLVLLHRSHVLTPNKKNNIINGLLVSISTSINAIDLGCK